MDGVVEIESQRDLPPGVTLRCVECGTRLRRGQPHTALAPKPHQTLSLLIVTDDIDDGLRGYVTGSRSGVTGYLPQLQAAETPRGRTGREIGRRVQNPLVLGPDLIWREAR